MSNFETPIDDIFRANGATGEYPSRPEPELPEDEDDRVGFKVWEVASVSKNRFDEKFAIFWYSDWTNVRAVKRLN